MFHLNSSCAHSFAYLLALGVHVNLCFPAGHSPVFICIYTIDIYLNKRWHSYTHLRHALTHSLFFTRVHWLYRPSIKWMEWKWKGKKTMFTLFLYWIALWKFHWMLVLFISTLLDASFDLNGQPLSFRGVCQCVRMCMDVCECE